MRMQARSELCDQGGRFRSIWKHLFKELLSTGPECWDQVTNKVDGSWESTRWNLFQQDWCG